MERRIHRLSVPPLLMRCVLVLVGDMLQLPPAKAMTWIAKPTVPDVVVGIQVVVGIKSRSFQDVNSLLSPQIDDDNTAQLSARNHTWQRSSRVEYTGTGCRELKWISSCSIGPMNILGSCWRTGHRSNNGTSQCNRSDMDRIERRLWISWRSTDPLC